MKDLILKNVSFSYPGDFLAVDNINIKIKGGENIAIIGQNGAGKTTTVKMMNGLLKPTKGDVLIGDLNTKDYTTAQISRYVGYVFQNPDDQIFHSTVESEIAFGPKMMKLSETEVKKRVDNALKLTNLTKEREENPYNLPLSIRKFVTIAAVIAMDTEILIFDEPTAGQDDMGNKQLTQILNTLHTQKKTVITISHDMEFVVNNFENIIVMAKKKVVKSGTPKEIFWDFETLEKANLKQPTVSDICRSLNIDNSIVHMDDAVNQIIKEINNS
ncbi:MAG: ABC transporter ATP-binding protein [Sphaerochaetaceae bacterium]|nr:ABC transporter ATP-binding protein [Sphaerochaetaceae bacterium]